MFFLNMTLFLEIVEHCLMLSLFKTVFYWVSIFQLRIFDFSKLKNLTASYKNTFIFIFKY